MSKDAEKLGDLKLQEQKMRNEILALWNFCNAGHTLSDSGQEHYRQLVANHVKVLDNIDNLEEIS